MRKANRIESASRAFESNIFYVLSSLYLIGFFLSFAYLILWVSITYDRENIDFID